MRVGLVPIIFQAISDVDSETPLLALVLFRKYQHNLTQLDLNRVVGPCGRAAAGANIKSDVAFHSDLCFTPPRL